MTIWIDGDFSNVAVVPLDPEDRLLAHGIGLFETLRTWNGTPILLPRHQTRVLESAETLGITLEPSDLPETKDVCALCDYDGISGDARLRIHVSGGGAGGEPKPLVWMTARPLGAGLHPHFGAVLVDCPWRIDPVDPLATFKTLNYWSRTLAYEQARHVGADDALFRSSDGAVWESSRCNLFLVIDGRLITPGPTGPFLPGVMRGWILEQADRLGLRYEQRPVFNTDLAQADEAFLTNAVHGVRPIVRWPDGRHLEPGPIIEQLRAAISTQLAP